MAGGETKSPDTAPSTPPTGDDPAQIKVSIDGKHWLPLPNGRLKSTVWRDRDDDDPLIEWDACTTLWDIEFVPEAKKKPDPEATRRKLPRPKGPAIHDMLAKLYERAKRRRRKPPSKRQAGKLGHRIMSRRGYYAPASFVERLADDQRYDGMRLLPGQRFKA